MMPSPISHEQEIFVNTETANKRRDQRLRKRLLQVLDAAKVRPESGWASGRFLYDVVDGALPGGQEFESDDHFAALVRDLISSGYVEERDDRRYEWQRQSIDFTSYRVTAKGTLLLVEELPADPLVEDGRRRREERG